ncbi:hypothetical protein [Neptuniibacter sp. 1_MG-2023]|uniref:hypothetical protein n=1 Tax=Neptuniibacter sp. 1_MG-2023 TaxID=3062662 RepID=UPI0026E18349|nr:hypothetical protein [Neptuniibacter sp. 1_MG-2023]MDO6593240.1 hypothetical protein [Neptuniibacter sp. 1_MG-2023]
MNISATQLANMLRSLASQSSQQRQSEQQTPEQSLQQALNPEQLLSSLGSSLSSPAQNDLLGSSRLQNSLRQLSNQSNLDASQLNALSEQLTPHIENAIKNGQFSDQ